MKHILNNLFLVDTINSLDSKYKDLTKDLEDKYFMYSNMFEVTLYYKPFHYRKNPDYRLYEKLHTLKHIDVIELIKTYVLENNYNPQYLLTLYSYICNVIFNYYVESYVKSMIGEIENKKKEMFKFSRYMKSLEAEYYSNRFKNNIKSHIIDYKEINLEETDLTLINDILKTVYFSSIGIEVYKIGLKKLHKYIKLSKVNFLGLSKPFYYTLDSLTKSKKYSISSLFVKKGNKKIDYLNKNKKTWKLYNVIEENKSFEELYEKAKNDCAIIINQINDEIFYQKKIKHGLGELLNTYIKNE